VYAPQARPLHEEDLCEPSSFYAATKLSAEMLCRQYANEMEIVIVRFFGIYGPGQSRNLVAQVVERVRKGVPVTLAGEDGLEINLLYLDDAAEVVRRLAIAPDLDSPFVVNAGHAHPASIRAIAEAAAAVLDCEPLYEYSEDNALNLTCDTSKLHNLYKPTTDLEAGIRNSIEREPVALA
jgi:nucleoside-diphosphate-sugar epimerase